MAVKSWHVSVTEGFKTIVYKQFFDVASANEFFVEMKEKYPKPTKPEDPKYVVIRENY